MNRTLTFLREKAVDVRPNELRALGLACVFNFVILGSYYVIRPIRDDIATRRRPRPAPWVALEAEHSVPARGCRPNRARYRKDSCDSGRLIAALFPDADSGCSVGTRIMRTA